MHVHTRACLSATCVHSWIQEFSPGWWAVRTHLVEKSPDNVFSPQLILQRGSGVQWGGGGGGGNGYFKETIIFPESKLGVNNFRGSNLFQGDGAQLLFSIKLVVFQGVPDSLYPLLICALPICTCPCLWPFKVTKHAVSSSKAKALRVIKKLFVVKIIFYLLRSFWEVPLVTTKTTLRWLYCDHNFTMILSCLRKLRCVRVSSHNR